MSFIKPLPSWVPRSFQKEGLKIALGQACCGFLLPPGAGKTSMVYMLVVMLIKLGFIRRALVICPIRPMYRVWPNQLKRFAEFAHLRVKVLHGDDKDAALCDDDADIYVVNPEGLDWLFAVQTVTNSRGKTTKVPDKVRLKWLAERFQMLVVDESTKFKNSQSNRFKVLKAAIPKFKRRYILTGTPTPAGLLDLFGQIYILDEGAALGGYITHYRTTYFYPSGFGGYDWTPQPDADRRIAEKIAPLVFRKDLKDANIDLPELVFDDIWVDLPPAVMREYIRMEQDLVAKMDADIDNDIVAENAAVASGKCRQIANGCLIDTATGKWTYLHDAKLEALEDLLEQLQGEPLLITYEFKPDAERIGGVKAMGQAIPNISSGKAKKDDANIELFGQGKLAAVQGNPQSIALGIDGLQDSCCHIAMYGCTWKLQDYLQVIDRVRRQGNKSKRVWVHRILARGTLDERMLVVLDDREANQDDFMKLLKELRK